MSDSGIWARVLKMIFPQDCMREMILHNILHKKNKKGGDDFLKKGFLLFCLKTPRVPWKILGHCLPEEYLIKR